MKHYLQINKNVFNDKIIICFVPADTADIKQISICVQYADKNDIKFKICEKLLSLVPFL